MVNTLSYYEEGKEISIAAGGDVMNAKKLSVFGEDKYLSLVKLIRDADIGFCNMETLYLDWREHYPAKFAGIGTMMSSEPHLTDEIRWIGIDMVSFAMSHTMDYGVNGMFATMKHLERVNIVHAGSGMTLDEAREPRYLETKKGRVALVAMCTGNQPREMASNPRGETLGRPGINLIRLSSHYILDKESFEGLSKIAKKLRLEIPHVWGAHAKVFVSEDELDFLRSKFKLGKNPGCQRTMNKADVEGNLRSIKDARRSADWVLVSYHGHESSFDGTEYPADFQIELAHSCIDAGSHAFLGHGPHILRGIEIYKGKPIIYGMGNLVAQNQLVKRVTTDQYESLGLDEKATPSDYYEERRRRGLNPPSEPPQSEWWYESAVFSLKFEGGDLTDLRFYPIALGDPKSRSSLGRPILAGKKLSNKIISRMKEISVPFKTNIAKEKGVGVVKLS